MVSKKSFEWLWSTWGVGILLTVIGEAGVLNKIHLKNFLAKHLSGSTYIKAVRLPNEIFMLGMAVICVSLGQKLLIYFEEPLTKLHDKLSNSKIIYPLKNKPLLFYSLFIIFCVFFLYHKCLNIFFIRDGISVLLIVQQTKQWYTLLTMIILNTAWRPLQFLVWFIAYRLFELNPFGYHLIFFSMHIINGIVVYLVAQQLYGKRVLSILAGIIFITRFSHFFAVALIQTPDPLLTMAVLLAFYFYLKAVKTKAPAYHFMSIICFILALMTKESAVVFPALLFLYEMIFQYRHGDWQRLKAIIKRLGWHTLILGVYSFVRYRQLTVAAKGGMYRMEIGKNFISNIINYPRFFFNGPLDACTIMVAILLGLFFFRLKNRSPLFENIKGEGVRGIIFGCLWFYISLSPVLFIWHVAKHYNYLPVIGLSLVMAWLAYHLFSKIRINHPALANVFIVSFLSLTVVYSFVKIDERASMNTGYLIYGTAARNYARDMKGFYPQLPKGAKVYFVTNYTEGEWSSKQYHWKVAHGANLFRLIYNDNSIKNRYLTKEELTKFSLGDNSFVFAFDRDHLYDLTPSLVKKQS